VDPNFFGNTPRLCGPDGELRDVAMGPLALHVTEVLEALIGCFSVGHFLDLTTRCGWPEPVPLGSNESVFD
jgi:hypothetical protein